jgi:cell division protein FtsN
MSRASTVRASHAVPLQKNRTRPTRKSGAGSTLVGIFIGLTLGLGIAAGVAFFLMKSGNPYQPSVAANMRDGRDPPRAAKSEPAAADKPRFDFYKILPGIEEPKLPAKTVERPATDKATLERAAVPDKAPAAPEQVSVAPPSKSTEPAPVAGKPGDRFWLQAGSFANQSDAENLKAQLALAGWEAAIQQATLPDKSVRYRVRLGPYASTDELTRAKGDLSKRGVDVAVIKF